MKSLVASGVVFLLVSASSAAPPAGFESLFNGKDLSGWEGRTDIWKVENGLLVGEHQGLKRNEFLTTAKSYRDFIFRADFRLVGGKGNSGVQFRSQRIANDSEMTGYQADIGEGYWGALYDESRRNKVLVGPKPETDAGKRFLAALKKDGWNHYEIRAMGSRISLSLNHVTTVLYEEKDSAIPRDGYFGLQIHADAKPARVEFREISIQELPNIEADAPGKVGFLHKEYTDSKGGKHNYAIYLPADYNSAQDKKYPAILFLHGSGERGADGIVQAQVGLGPAIAKRKEFPFIVVFAQAKQTWREGSDDAQAALAELEATMKHYRVDAKQIHLTGLSMGGAGTWGLVTAHPQMWATATVVCGFGDSKQCEKVAKLPIQLFCGEDDSKRIVESMKTIQSTLAGLNAPIQATWYKGVGHNSWDNAYNTDSLYQWMLAHPKAN